MSIQTLTGADQGWFRYNWDTISDIECISLDGRTSINTKSIDFDVRMTPRGIEVRAWGIGADGSRTALDPAEALGHADRDWISPHGHLVEATRMAIDAFPGGRAAALPLLQAQYRTTGTPAYFILHNLDQRANYVGHGSDSYLHFLSDPAPAAPAAPTAAPGEAAPEAGPEQPYADYLRSLNITDAETSATEALVESVIGTETSPVANPSAAYDAAIASINAGTGDAAAKERQILLLDNALYLNLPQDFTGRLQTSTRGDFGSFRERVLRGIGDETPTELLTRQREHFAAHAATLFNSNPPNWRAIAELMTELQGPTNSRGEPNRPVDEGGARALFEQNAQGAYATPVGTITGHSSLTAAQVRSIRALQTALRQDPPDVTAVLRHADAFKDGSAEKLDELAVEFCDDNPLPDRPRGRNRLPTRPLAAPEAEEEDATASSEDTSEEPASDNPFLNAIVSRLGGLDRIVDVLFGWLQPFLRSIGLDIGDPPSPAPSTNSGGADNDVDTNEFEERAIARLEAAKAEITASADAADNNALDEIEATINALKNDTSINLTSEFGSSSAQPPAADLSEFASQVQAAFSGTTPPAQATAEQVNAVLKVRRPGE